MNTPNDIHILGFAPNVGALRLAEAEVRRIGRNPVRFVNIASAWDAFCTKHISPEIISGYMKRLPAFSCNRGHLHIVQAAYEMGEEYIWVMEDDARFFKDVGRLNAALAAAPDDADILILDPIYKDFHTEPECFAKAAKAVNGWWCIFKEDVRSTGSYIMSRRAMKTYIDLLARGTEGRKVHACDCVRNHKFFTREINIYAAHPNLSIQRQDDKHKHMSSFDTIYKRYIAQGLILSDYADWEV